MTERSRPSAARERYGQAFHKIVIRFYMVTHIDAGFDKYNKEVFSRRYLKAKKPTREYDKLYAI
jgi:hypothetical protein